MYWRRSFWAGTVYIFLLPSNFRVGMPMHRIMKSCKKRADLFVKTSKNFANVVGFQATEFVDRPVQKTLDANSHPSFHVFLEV